jgi:hypothetical protein
VCVKLSIGAPSMSRLIRRAVTLARMWPTLDLRWEMKGEGGGQSDEKGRIFLGGYRRMRRQECCCKRVNTVEKQ